jgi:hypothetical protein
VAMLLFAAFKDLFKASTASVRLFSSNVTTVLHSE